MRRLYRTWYILRTLKNDCLGHIVNEKNIEDIKRRLLFGVKRDAFINTISNFRKNKKLSPEKLKTKMQEYQSIISSCLTKGLIKYISPYDVITVSPKGDEYISRFIYDKFFGNVYVKTLIIAVITGIVGLYIKNLLSSIPPVPAQILQPVVNVYTTSSAPAVNVYPAIYTGIK